MKIKPTADVQANYVDETLRFIESDEMKEHLRNWPEPLKIDDCVDIVLEAPAALEKKIAALKSIDEQTSQSCEKKRYSEINRWARHFSHVLDERHGSTYV